jgi:hypothetical protein
MHRGTLCALAGLALLWAAWRVGAQAVGDVAILHVRDVEDSDRYVTLWAVEDAGSIWLRAARPDREWLDWLVERPKVELELDGESHFYTAEIFEQPEARERVDELMREKYLWADRIRELLLGNDTVPVRLELAE